MARIGEHELLEPMESDGAVDSAPVRTPSGATGELRMLSEGVALIEATVARFAEEVPKRQQLGASGLVPLLAWGLEPRPHVVEDRSGAVPLRRLLDDAGGRLDPTLAATVGAGVLEVLTRIDAAGLAHGGLSPDSIRLRPDGKVLLADLAFGRLVADHAASVTLVLQKTVDYLSPEQAKSLEVTPASDVFGLGAILYECMVGKPPFSAPTPLARSLKLSMGNYERLDSAAPDAPADLRELVTSMLASQPSGRPRAEEAHRTLVARGGLPIEKLREVVRSKLAEEEPSGTPEQPAASPAPASPAPASPAQASPAQANPGQAAPAWQPPAAQPSPAPPPAQPAPAWQPPAAHPAPSPAPPPAQAAPAWQTPAAPPAPAQPPPAQPPPAQPPPAQPPAQAAPAWQPPAAQPAPAQAPPAQATPAWQPPAAQPPAAQPPAAQPPAAQPPAAQPPSAQPAWQTPAAQPAWQTPAPVSAASVSVPDLAGDEDEFDAGPTLASPGLDEHAFDRLEPTDPLQAQELPGADDFDESPENVPRTVVLAEDQLRDSHRDRAATQPMAPPPEALGYTPPPSSYAAPSAAAVAPYQPPRPAAPQPPATQPTPPTRRDDRGAILLYVGVGVGAFFLLGLVLALAITLAG